MVPELMQAQLLKQQFPIAEPVARGPVAQTQEYNPAVAVSADPNPLPVPRGGGQMDFGGGFGGPQQMPIEQRIDNVERQVQGLGQGLNQIGGQFQGFMAGARFGGGGYGGMNMFQPPQQLGFGGMGIDPRMMQMGYGGAPQPSREQAMLQALLQTQQASPFANTVRTQGGIGALPMGSAGQMLGMNQFT